MIDIDLSNNQNLILATIYCPNGNPNLRLFETINNLSDNVMFVGDFNSKSEAFGCAKKTHLVRCSKLFKLIRIPFDIDKYADFITTAISTAVDKAVPKAKSGRPESQPISDETLALIKEKRKLRRQYSQAHDPLVKTRINQLQEEIKDNFRIESQASLEKFCNGISLETNHTESWRKIKNFLKPKGQRDYPALRRDAKTVKTNADKAQLFAESVERHFGIQSNNFDSNHFDVVNQFIEDNYEYFYPPEDPDDYRSDMNDDHDLVADIDSDTLIKIVKFLRRGKAPGPDNIHNEVLRLSTTTSLFHHLARLFTSSKNRLHPNCMETSNPPYVTET